MADVDGDGEVEVVFGSWDHYVYCLRGSDGSLRWRHQLGYLITSSPVLADVDHDGVLESS